LSPLKKTFINLNGIGIKLKRDKMILKKQFLLLVFLAIAIISLFSFVCAATNLITPVQNDNYTSTITFNCTTTNTTIANMTIWYNTSVVSDRVLTIILNNTGGTVNDLMFNNTFSVSNLTDSRTYRFWCSAQNFTGPNVNSTANTSITIDNTAPVIALPLYTNATAKKNTTTLTLNISVIDGTIGLNGSVCLVNMNGTSTGINQSFAVSGGWCNFTTGDLTGMNDGYNGIKIYVNDTLSNLGLNNTFYVITDTTNPTALPVCSPTTVNTGDTFPCSCGGSDATAGLNSSLTSGSSTSPNGLLTPSSSGTFTYTCSVTDYAGNLASTTATYVVEEETSHSPSGSSSPTTTILPSVKSQIFAQMTPGVASIMSNFAAGTALKEIQINVNSEAQSVKVSVAKYDSKPAAVSAEKTGNTYQYLQINASNVEGKLSKAIVTMKVNKSWVSENSLGKEDMALFKFNGTSGQWNELPTIYSSEDSTYYYYTTELTSFSYFAIGEKSLVSGEETAAGETTGGETSVTGNLTWLWIVIAAAVLAVAVVMAIVRKKRKKK
jgi:PGF-pre-PGF domain-containing protein